MVHKNRSHFCNKRARKGVTERPKRAAERRKLLLVLGLVRSSKWAKAAGPDDGNCTLQPKCAEIANTMMRTGCGQMGLIRTHCSIPNKIRTASERFAAYGLIAEELDVRREIMVLGRLWLDQVRAEVFLIVVGEDGYHDCIAA